MYQIFTNTLELVYHNRQKYELKMYNITKNKSKFTNIFLSFSLWECQFLYSLQQLNERLTAELYTCEMTTLADFVMFMNELFFFFPYLFMWHSSEESTTDISMDLMFFHFCDTVLISRTELFILFFYEACLSLLSYSRPFSTSSHC